MNSEGSGVEQPLPHVLAHPGFAVSRKSSGEGRYLPRDGLCHFKFGRHPYRFERLPHHALRISMYFDDVGAGDMRERLIEASDSCRAPRQFVARVFEDEHRRLIAHDDTLNRIDAFAVA